MAFPYRLPTLAGYQFRANAFYKSRNERAILRRLREPRSRDVSIKKTRGRLAASIHRRKYKRRAGSPVTSRPDLPAKRPHFVEMCCKTIAVHLVTAYRAVDYFNQSDEPPRTRGSLKSASKHCKNKVKPNYRTMWRKNVAPIFQRK